MANNQAKPMWPAPVYICQFKGGETLRLTTMQYHGQPMNFDRPKRGAQVIVGQERGRAAMLADVSAPERRRLIGMKVKMGAVDNIRAVDVTRRGLIYVVFPPAPDIIAGHIEHDGVRYFDPTLPPADDRPKADNGAPKGRGFFT